MVRFSFSNNLIGILNIITFVISIPIIIGGIWLSRQQSSECERFLDRPVIALGAFILLVSIAGIIGAFCRVKWLMWVYLLVMFLLIVLLFCFTIFAFVVTRKGSSGQTVSGQPVSGRRVKTYSNWMQKRVNGNWGKIRSCLVEGEVCQRLLDAGSTPIDKFYEEHLSDVQSGCCKPPTSCNFQYVSPTNWTQTPTSTSSANPDCTEWSNDPTQLCYNCQSCKVGFVENIKSDWKTVAVINIISLAFLIIVYFVGLRAFRNNSEDNNPWKRYP